MRKEQREYIINKLQTAVHTRMSNEEKSHPTKYVRADYVAAIKAAGLTVADEYYASRVIRLPDSPEHVKNKEYLDQLRERLNSEVDAVRTSLMLSKDPDAITMLSEALARIQGE